MRISDWSSDVCSSDLLLVPHIALIVRGYDKALTSRAGTFGSTRVANEWGAAINPENKCRVTICSTNPPPTSANPVGRAWQGAACRPSGRNTRPSRDDPPRHPQQTRKASWRERGG